MSEYRARIDQVLVHLFNDILRIEEESLHRRGVHGLSMREIHVLQAIMESGEENTMSAVAARLHVTVGSLTVAINTLVRKGYVERQRSSQDKRCIHLLLTPPRRRSQPAAPGFPPPAHRCAAAGNSPGTPGLDLPGIGRRSRLF